MIQVTWTDKALIGLWIMFTTYCLRNHEQRHLRTGLPATCAASVVNYLLLRNSWQQRNGGCSTGIVPTIHASLIPDYKIFCINTTNTKEKPMLILFRVVVYNNF